jgi:hypothetical protein
MGGQPDGRKGGRRSYFIPSAARDLLERASMTAE